MVETFQRLLNKITIAHTVTFCHRFDSTDTDSARSESEKISVFHQRTAEIVVVRGNLYLTPDSKQGYFSFGKVATGFRDPRPEVMASWIVSAPKIKVTSEEQDNSLGKTGCGRNLGS
jgi:hypothetical protein